MNPFCMIRKALHKNTDFLFFDFSILFQGKSVFFIFFMFF